MKNKFVVTDNAEVQGSLYLNNYQLAESDVIIELEDKRIWLTDVYRCVFFNQFITEKIKEEFMRWAIINGLSGASWPFKRFESLSLNVIQKLKKVMN